MPQRTSLDTSTGECVPGTIEGCVNEKLIKIDSFDDEYFARTCYSCKDGRAAYFLTPSLIGECSSTKIPNCVEGGLNQKCNRCNAGMTSYDGVCKISSDGFEGCAYASNNSKNLPVCRKCDWNRGYYMLAYDNKCQK